MRGRRSPFGSRTLACLSIIGAAGIGGLAAGFAARPALAPAPASVIVRNFTGGDRNLRFPAEWESRPRGGAYHAGIRLHDERRLLAVQPARPSASVREAKAEQVEAEVKPRPRPSAAAIGAAARCSVAAATSKPTAPARRSNSVLSESQLASIKRRLNLTPDQERYWPAVAAELRKMEYKRDGKPAQGGRMARGRHEQGRHRWPQVRRIPVGHELQRRSAPRAQVARASARSRKRDVRVLIQASFVTDKPGIAPGFLFRAGPATPASSPAGSAPRLAHEALYDAARIRRQDNTGNAHGHERQGRRGREQPTA